MIFKEAVQCDSIAVDVCCTKKARSSMPRNSLLESAMLDTAVGLDSESDSSWLGQSAWYLKCFGLLAGAGALLYCLLRQADLRWEYRIKVEARIKFLNLAIESTVTRWDVSDRVIHTQLVKALNPESGIHRFVFSLPHEPGEDDCCQIKDSNFPERESIDIKTVSLFNSIQAVLPSAASKAALDAAILAIQPKDFFSAINQALANLYQRAAVKNHQPRFFSAHDSSTVLLKQALVQAVAALDDFAKKECEEEKHEEPDDDYIYKNKMRLLINVYSQLYQLNERYQLPAKLQEDTAVLIKHCKAHMSFSAYDVNSEAKYITGFRQEISEDFMEAVSGAKLLKKKAPDIDINRKCAQALFQQLNANILELARDKKKSAKRAVRSLLTIYNETHLVIYNALKNNQPGADLNKKLQELTRICQSAAKAKNATIRKAIKIIRELSAGSDERAMFASQCY